jgi:molecular chaperone IbpA
MTNLGRINTLFPASFVGFDRLFDEIDRFSTPQTYPPHNLVNVSENKYDIELAVAGFSEADINIEFKDGTVIVTGDKSEKDERDYAHRGISGRKFERTFKLADHVEVVGASLVNGILTINLERIVPEELMPRRIPIQTSTPELLTEVA